MSGKKKLPIGIDIFEKMDREEFYYVDKTGMIEDLIQNRSEVNLFNRPRRFGKSLNMSMLKTFFEIGSDAGLFAGLKIAEDKELCEKYMGQFPVISISLKSVEGLSFEAAKKALKDILGVEAGRFYFLTKSSKLTAEEIESYKALPSMQGFFSICEYLQITPGDFFNEDSEAPREVRELMEKIEKLTPEQRTLIRQIVEQFLGE